MKKSDKQIEKLFNAIDTDKETQELLKSIVPDGIKLKVNIEALIDEDKELMKVLQETENKLEE